MIENIKVLLLGGTGAIGENLGEVLNKKGIWFMLLLESTEKMQKMYIIYREMLKIQLFKKTFE